MKTRKQTEGVTRATMRLPLSLWKAVQHRAVDEQIELQQLAEQALREYLKKGGH
jgi:predicted HicB family RNase H-like nuclease